MASFEDDVAAFAKKASGSASRAVRAIAAEVFRRVILRTPVDTGRARSNWFASIGAASTETTESTSRPSASDAQRVAMAYKPETEQSVFLANNLPYIETLERGRVGNRGSLQAPQGMVAITVAEFGGIAQSEARE